MGVGFDGAYRYEISFSSPDGIAASIVMGVFIIWTIIVIGIVANDVWQEPKKMVSKNLLILQIIVSTSLCNPLLFWLTNFLGSLDLLLTNIAQWRIYGPGAFAFIVVIYECWHVFFMLSKLTQFQRMNSFLGHAISPEAKIASRNLKMLVMFDVTLSLLGLFIYLSSFVVPDGSLTNSISAIGATFGEAHCLTITFYFKLVKLMMNRGKNDLNESSIKSVTMN
ncbi:hypothetical protein HDV04_000762 [Boothiomyces sp. JEL0838]|nr:hypothetical protein HDV04_000762 [Boothiomyces sp. JEL0838]